jgi:hypothetical protein
VVHACPRVCFRREARAFFLVSPTMPELLEARLQVLPSLQRLCSYLRSLGVELVSVSNANANFYPFLCSVQALSASKNPLRSPFFLLISNCTTFSHRVSHRVVGEFFPSDYPFHSGFLSSKLSPKTFGIQGPTVTTFVLLMGSSRSFFPLPANFFPYFISGVLLQTPSLSSSCSVQALPQRVGHPRAHCHCRFPPHRRPFLRQHKRAHFHPAAPNLRPNPGSTRRALSRRGGLWSSDDAVAGV